MRKFTAFAGAIALAAMTSAVPANALKFVLTDTSNGGAAPGTQARQGFDIATNFWSKVLTDNITVNLNIGFASLATNVIGSTGSARSLLSMSAGYAALAGDSKSAFDALSVATLQPLGVSAIDPSFGAITFTANAINTKGNGYIDTATRIDNDGGVNNSTLAITKASAKALGLTTDVNGNPINYGSADASVTFSSNFAFDFNPTNGIDSDKIDFIGVAIHEIGHALGFVSGVDSYDARTVASPTTNGAGLLENFVVNSQLDLFRYSAPGQIDWSTQNTPYFSIDGGATMLFGDSKFSQGVRFGDGRQASHFKDSPPEPKSIGIMDPTFARGETGKVTGLDLAAFDVIGYDLKYTSGQLSKFAFTSANAYNVFFAAAPEPAVWMQLIIGFGVIGGTIRQRRRREVMTFA